MPNIQGEIFDQNIDNVSFDENSSTEKINNQIAQLNRSLNDSDDSEMPFEFEEESFANFTIDSDQFHAPEEENDGQPKNLVKLKGVVEQAEKDFNAKVYKAKLLLHVIKMDEQLQGTNKANPFMFKYAFEQFRIFLINHWHEIDYDMDRSLKK